MPVEVQDHPLCASAYQYSRRRDHKSSATRHVYDSPALWAQWNNTAPIATSLYNGYALIAAREVNRACYVNTVEYLCYLLFRPCDTSLVPCKSSMITNEVVEHCGTTFAVQVAKVGSLPACPVVDPTAMPTTVPTGTTPTASPTETAPTDAPTVAPTEAPSTAPPTAAPSSAPTEGVPTEATPTEAKPTEAEPTEAEPTGANDGVRMP